jgi:hypothetical protein
MDEAKIAAAWLAVRPVLVGAATVTVCPYWFIVVVGP